MYGIKDKLPNLPERISGLRELAYNLWWSWHPEGRALFKLLSRQGWYLSNHNPVKMLNSMDKRGPGVGLFGPSLLEALRCGHGPV